MHESCKKIETFHPVLRCLIYLSGGTSRLFHDITASVDPLFFKKLPLFYMNVLQFWKIISVANCSFPPSELQFCAE